MILTITRYTAQLALKIEELVSHSQLTDANNLQLLIIPGEINDTCGCKPLTMGSPWLLHGCWPYHPTDVDVANPQLPDFPTLAYDGFDVDEEGRIVFHFDDRLWELPDGRYTGILRIKPILPPINLPQNIPKLDSLYTAQSHYTAEHRIEPCNFVAGNSQFTLPPTCVLATFDIDLVPHCAQHMISQVNVVMTQTSCQFEGE